MTKRRRNRVFQHSVWLLGTVIFLVAIRQYHLAFQFTQKEEVARNPEPLVPNQTTSGSSVGVSARTASAASINATANDSSTASNSNKLYYVGRFGLGHRLSKLSAAYHLAFELNLPEVELHWGSCQTEKVDISTVLFGTHILQVPRHDTHPVVVAAATDHSESSKTILVRNDVAGYYAGQNYKNAQRPLTHNVLDSLWWPKLQLDRKLFHHLLDQFMRMQHDNNKDYDNVFQTVTSDWRDYTVIGLHIRAGNGEGDHFQQAGRSVYNTEFYVQSTCQLIHAALRNETVFGATNNKPPLLFVATDTPSVLAIIHTACAPLPIRVLPQARVETKGGVSYQQWNKGSQCFDGWRSSMMDMALLAHTDILIAAMRSTFTQILPRALVQERQGGIFCEVGSGGGHSVMMMMSCFENERQWLLRETQPKTVSLPVSGDGGRDHPDNTTVGSVPTVTHKVMVHFPDWDKNEWAVQARAFLQDSSPSSDPTFVYGPRFDKKYRSKGEFREEWTWLG